MREQDEWKLVLLAYSDESVRQSRNRSDLVAAPSARGSCRVHTWPRPIRRSVCRWVVAAHALRLETSQGPSPESGLLFARWHALDAAPYCNKANTTPSQNSAW